MKLKGKIAVVTGGTRGIGYATSLLFAKNGARVVMSYANDDQAARRAHVGLTRVGATSFITKEDAVQKCIDHYGGIDILVNNAGVSKPSMLLKMDEKDWDEVMNVNLKEVFKNTQVAAKYMKTKNYGKIINVTSPAAIFGTVGQINYSSAKSALIGFTKSAARELARYNINVNVICPGIINTSMIKPLVENEKLNKLYTSRICFQRFGEPEEVAPAFLFLASDDASYITGSVMKVDGGYVGHVG